METSLRQRNKQEKLARIKQAAYDLFKSKGYAATTTRDIAEVAQVGAGTLFLYVKDKQDLLSLVYFDEIARQIEAAFDTLPDNLSLLDELLHIFSFFFKFYAEDPDTSRVYISSLTFQKELQGQRRKAATQIAQFGGRLVQRVDAAKNRGELRSDLDAVQASRNFFALYFAALVAWLGGTTDMETALNQVLRDAFDLQIKGMIN